MQKIDYSKYDLGDFAADEYFVEWVLRPDLQSDAFWTQWQSNHPGYREKLHEARLVVLMMHSRKMRMRENQKDNLWKKIHQQTTAKNTAKVRKLSPQFLMYAAACVAFITVIFAGIMYVNRDLQNDYAITENPAGKTSVVYLEDGTKVWLNASSKLSYQKSFAQEPVRMVKLEGEAFFEVVENKDKPFIVMAREMQVKVLGTAFNVKAFASGHKIETTLLRGRVEARVPESNTSPVVLHANQQATWDNKKHTMSVLDAAAEKIAAWREGVLIFDNTPFSEVKESLERRYGVTIIMEDEQSLTCHFSGVVKDEPITKVLALLQTTSKITYEINGNAVRLKGSLCQHGSSTP